MNNRVLELPQAAPAAAAHRHAPLLPEVMSIVHDLRTPLSTIHGSAELLVCADLSDLQVRRLARNLYDASKRMNELLEEFLAQYRRIVEPPESCDVRELVNNAVDEVRLRAQLQFVQISHNLPEGLTIVMDRPRIRRVLVNLLVNSLDVMPDGGGIVISAIAQTQTVLIKVSDTGPGITPEIRDRLFQPFATAGKAKGFGLGLACSRRALIECGGEIWAEDVSRGACFVVCLPRAPGHDIVDLASYEARVATA